MKTELTSLLRANSNLFAWVPEDMLEIDIRVICHILAIDAKV